MKFTNRQLDNLIPYNPRPGRPKTLNYLEDLEGIKPYWFSLPFNKQELIQLTASIGKTEEELKSMILQSKLPRNPTGDKQHPLYNRWKDRINNRKTDKICLRWCISFRFFCLDIGRPPTDKSRLKRINLNKPWASNNVRWI